MFINFLLKNDKIFDSLPISDNIKLGAITHKNYKKLLFTSYNNKWWDCSVFNTKQNYCLTLRYKAIFGFAFSYWDAAPNVKKGSAVVGVSFFSPFSENSWLVLDRSYYKFDAGNAVLSQLHSAGFIDRFDSLGKYYYYYVGYFSNKRHFYVHQKNNFLETNYSDLFGLISSPDDMEKKLLSRTYVNETSLSSMSLDNLKFIPFNSKYKFFVHPCARSFQFTKLMSSRKFPYGFVVPMYARTPLSENKIFYKFTTGYLGRTLKFFTGLKKYKFFKYNKKSFKPFYARFCRLGYERAAARTRLSLKFKMFVKSFFTLKRVISSRDLLSFSKRHFLHHYLPEAKRAKLIKRLARTSITKRDENEYIRSLYYMQALKVRKFGGSKRGVKSVLRRAYKNFIISGGDNVRRPGSVAFKAIMYSSRYARKNYRYIF